MIAYSITSIRNLKIVETAKRWLDKNIISAVQFQQIKEKHPHHLFIPSVFIRVGLFFLTLLLVNAALGLLSMVFILSDISTSSIGGVMIFYGVIVIVGLETLILNKRAFRAGMDDALLYMALGFIISGFYLLFNRQIESSDHELLIYSVIALPFLVTGSVRYLDNLVCSLVFICVNTIVFSITIKLGPVAKTLVPFIMMISCGGMYFLAGKYSNRKEIDIFISFLYVLQFLSLLGIYLSCNYYVVRELSIKLFDLSPSPDKDIPLGFFFQLLTLAVPIVYLYFAQRNKSRLILWCGLVTSFLTIITFYHYYSIWSVSLNLVFLGLFLSLSSWFCIRYYSGGKQGITSDKDMEFISSDLEAVALSVGASNSQVIPEREGIEFGGGKFGGGGAGGNY